MKLVWRQWSILIYVMVLLSGCGMFGPGSHLEDSTQNSKVSSTSTAPICEASAVVDKLNCSVEILHSLAAHKDKICSSDGMSTDLSNCVLDTCEAGYLKQGNICLVQACNPNQSYGDISCTAEILHSQMAKKSKDCNSTGLDYIYGSCQLEQCMSGYYKSGNSCVAQSCTPNQMDFEDCKADIPNAMTAQKSRTCNSNGSSYTYGSCSLQTCKSGYYKSGNMCVAQACVPDQYLGMVSCNNEIPHSQTTEKTQTCNSDGSGYVYGSCSLVVCESGYYKYGNSCLPQTCNPGDTMQVDCASEMTNATVATKSKTCNAFGSGYMFGTCIATACDAGYEVSGAGTCIYKAMPLVSVTGVQFAGAMQPISYHGVDTLGRIISADGPSTSELPNADYRKYFREPLNHMVLDKNGDYFETYNGDLSTDLMSPWSNNLKDIAVDATDLIGNFNGTKVARKYGLTKSDGLWITDDAGTPHTWSPYQGKDVIPGSPQLISVADSLQCWVINESNQLFLLNLNGGEGLGYKYYILFTGNADGDLPSGATKIISAFRCSESSSHLCILDDKNKTWAWKTSSGGRWASFNTGLPK